MMFVQVTQLIMSGRDRPAKGARRPQRLRRCRAVALALAVWISPGAAARASPPADFAAFIAGLRPEAERLGLSDATFDAAFAEVTPDPSVAAMIQAQPEFAKPIGAYLAAQVTPNRIAAGRAMLGRWSGALAEIERRYDVPRAIIVAIWGLETNYGAAAGSKDVIRSLATLAAMNYRPALYRAELLAALKMLQDGEVARRDLHGSWAGAMGQPQFMPSSFEKYAVDWDGAGRRDIWTNVPDALASIANFVRSQGWRPGASWGFEVRLPIGFNDGQSRASLSGWAARGVTRADGSPLAPGGEAVLFFPAGAGGPAFLVTPNFEVLKTYNFSDAYVLSVAQLADRMEGGSPILATWPSDIPMARTDRIVLQARLAGLGYDVDNREGRISLALRDVIRLAQKRVNMIPDGNPTARLLHALNARP